MSYVKWTCKYCTYENYPASLKCVICCQPKNYLVIEPPPLIYEKRNSLTTEKNEEKETKSASNSTEKQSDLIIDCSLDNKNNNDSLNDCATKNKRNIQNEDDPHIKCHNCTYLNDITKSHCEMCAFTLIPQNASTVGATASNQSPTGSNENQRLSKDKYEIQNTKWTCANCTYANWERSLKCVMCLSSKTPESNNTIDPSPKAEAKKPVTSSSSESDDCTKESEPHECENKQKCITGTSNTSKTTTKLSTSLSVPNVSSSFRARSSSSSSNSSNSSTKDDTSSPSNSKTASNKNAGGSRNGACSGSYLQRSGSKSRISATLRKELKDLNNCDKECTRHIKNRMKNLNLLFLKACIGVVDNNIEAVERYLSHGGSVARALTAEEVRVLNRPSAFDVGHTLVHLAIRFRRHEFMALILQPEVTSRVLKRCPSLVCPDLTDLISHEILGSLRRRKGEFHCRYFCENVTFQLPLEITDLPNSFRVLLFDELLDQDAQKELEEDLAINWCPDLMNNEKSNRLHALWNRSAGDCLLDSVLQATWGIFDKENILRRAMAETLHDCAPFFYKRWKDWELMQARMLGYSLTERQCLQDWAFILSLAQQPGSSLEHCHIFVLAHVLRRPVIVYSVKYLKNYHGDTLGYTKFQGVYLPLFWDQSFCWKSPIALGFTRGHFSALVSMESDGMDMYGCGAHYQRNNQQPSTHHAYLPLVDSERKILPVHFTAPGEAVTEAERECLLYEWLDCKMTNSGILVAKQKTGKRPPLVTRMLDQWLDHYRHLSIRRLGEVGDSEEE